MCATVFKGREVSAGVKQCLGNMHIPNVSSCACFAECHQYIDYVTTSYCRDHDAVNAADRLRNAASDASAAAADDAAAPGHDGHDGNVPEYVRAGVWADESVSELYARADAGMRQRGQAH